MGRAPGPPRRRLCRRPVARGDPRLSRHADRARPQQPLPRSHARGEPGPAAPHARGRVPGRRPRSAREDRHGVRQHQSARSGALPHPACRAPPHRRCLAHLPDLRLRAWPVGCDRGRHALAVHARVRGPSAAVRLADRASAGAEPAAPVRVRAPQSVAHHPVQAPPDPAGRGRPRPRLGRSPDADARRAAPARGAAGRDPRVRAPHRRREEATTWSTSRCSSTACARC